MRFSRLLKSNQPAPPSPPAATFDFAFDTPQEWELAHKPLRVVFRGWIVDPDDEHTEVVVTDASGEETVHQMTIDRPDVVAHFAGLGHDAPLRCGFEFVVDVVSPHGSDFSLTVELKSSKHSSGPLEFTAHEFRSMRWPPAPDAPGSNTPRGDYNSTWQSVTGDEGEAKLAVAGTTSEEGFAAAAAFTLDLLQRTVGVHAEDEILEIGCGVGRMAASLSPRCKRWIGSDVSANMLDFARTRSQGLDNVEYVEVNGWDLAPFADESLDLVYCTVVFMHLDEWERFNYVCEAMRVLRPGGRVFIDNYNLLSTEGWDFFMKTMLDYHPLQRPPNISKSSTYLELRHFLAKAGFVDIDHQEDDTQFVYAWGRKPD